MNDFIQKKNYQRLLALHPCVKNDDVHPVWKWTFSGTTPSFIVFGCTFVTFMTIEIRYGVDCLRLRDTGTIAWKWELYRSNLTLYCSMNFDCMILRKWNHVWQPWEFIWHSYHYHYHHCEFILYIIYCETKFCNNDEFFFNFSSSVLINDEMIHIKFFFVVIKNR